MSFYHEHLAKFSEWLGILLSKAHDGNKYTLELINEGFTDMTNDILNDLENRKNTIDQKLLDPVVGYFDEGYAAGLLEAKKILL